MRHIDQVMFFYTLKTDKGIRHYECFSTFEALRMAQQDGLKVVDIKAVEVNAEDIPNFVVYGHKGGK